MKVVSSVGLRLISSLLDTGSVEAFTKVNINESTLKPLELEYYEYIKNFVYEHKAVPQKSRMFHELDIASLPSAKEVPSFYANQVRDRFISDEIKRGYTKAASYLQKDTMNVSKAVAKLTKSLLKIHKETNSKNMMDFKHSKDYIAKAYKTKKVLGGDGLVKLGYKTLDILTDGLVGGDLVSIVGRPAMGKFLELTTPILTNKGAWVSNGDLQVGDSLASIDGRPNHVTAIYPQGVKPIYKLTYSDGRVITGGDEHLWVVVSSKWKTPRTITTLQIQELLTKARYKNRLTLLGHEGKFGTPVNKTIDPWLLGFLIGDGCFVAKSLQFTNTEEYILYRVVESVPSEYRVNTYGTKEHAICYKGKHTVNPIKKDLLGMGLWGCTSPNKYIPREYFEGSYLDRMNLLCGLIESDGWVQNHSIQYSTSSPTLAKDIIRLVQSLGGKSSYRVKKITKYSYKGQIKYGLSAHILSIAVPNLSNHIRSPRIDVPTRKKSYQPYITSVEYSHDAEAQCISVSHSSRLYIMDKYLTTHNTWSTLYTAHHVFNVQEKTVLYVLMEMNMLSIQQRLTSMHTKKNLTQLKKAQLSTLDHDKMLKSLGGLATKKNSLWVVDGNLTATVEDIWKLAMQLSPDLIIVDGAYLLRHPNPRISKFERVSENTEMLKQMVATDLDVPVICSWQFNREATRKLEKNKDAKAGLEDIGYSDAIGQLSSLVLGLTQSESVETLVVREVDILKGRNGETGTFYMNWDFFNMEFSEVNYDPKDKTQGGMQNM